MKQLLHTLLIGSLLASVAQGTFGQTDDLQSSIHEKVSRFAYADPGDEKLVAERQALTGYSEEQIVRALITEVSTDCSTPMGNKDRDLGAYKVFRALGLPPTPICQELDKPQSPQRKASLIFLLRKVKSPEVIPALLRQIGDRRPAVEPMGFTEVIKPHAMRVCDEAFNALAINFGLPALRLIRGQDADSSRDRHIRETLSELKLAAPE